MELENLAPKQQDSSADENAEELARLRQEKEALAAQLRQRQEAETNYRISELERSMQERYRAVRDVPNAPPAEPTYAAQHELGITDEEILANPKEAIQRISEHIANQRMSEMQSQVTQVLGHQVRRGFDGEMASLQSHPYYADLAPSLQSYFESNPQEMIEAGTVRRRFNELVGANLDTLTRLSAEREAKRKVDEETQRISEQPGASRSRVVEPTMSVGTPMESASSTKKEFTLDPDPSYAAEKRDLIDAFNRYGANLTEEEWVEIESGKALPKKIAADMQVRGGKPNVEY